MTAHLVTSAGRLAYEERGSGAPIVLLHATLHDHRDFDPIVPTLAARFRTIAVDWPGHGCSDTPPEPNAVLFADVLAEMVAQLDLPPAVFIGNSVGGFAAARLAITHPARVAGLVLVNTGGFNRLNLFSRSFTWLLGHRSVARLMLPAMVPGYMKASTATDRQIRDRAMAKAKTSEGAAVGAAVWRGFLSPEFNLRARAAQVTQPTLLVWGARDTVLPLRAGRAALAVLPHARLEALDTGHVVFSSAPERFLSLVEPFVSTCLTQQPDR